MESGFYNMDCMEAMNQFPDKFFDLAIVDPPYGDGGQNIGGGGSGSDRGSTGTSIHYQRKNCRKSDGTWGYANWRNVGDEIRKKIVAWDVAPEQDYFDELFRVSRYQIIWGATTSTFHRQGISSYGASCLSARVLVWQWLNTHGQTLLATRRCLSVRHKEPRTSNAFTRRRSP